MTFDPDVQEKSLTCTFDKAEHACLKTVRKNGTAEDWHFYCQNQYLRASGVGPDTSHLLASIFLAEDFDPDADAYINDQPDISLYFYRFAEMILDSHYAFKHSNGSIEYTYTL